MHDGVHSYVDLSSWPPYESIESFFAPSDSLLCLINASLGPEGTKLSDLGQSFLYARLRWRAQPASCESSWRAAAIDHSLPSKILRASLGCPLRGHSIYEVDHLRNNHCSTSYRIASYGIASYGITGYGTTGQEDEQAIGAL